MVVNTTLEPIAPHQVGQTPDVRWGRFGELPGYVGLLADSELVRIVLSGRSVHLAELLLLRFGF